MKDLIHIPNDERLRQLKLSRTGGILGPYLMGRMGRTPMSSTGSRRRDHAVNWEALTAERARLRREHGPRAKLPMGVVHPIPRGRWRKP